MNDNYENNNFSDITEEGAPAPGEEVSFSDEAKPSEEECIRAEARVTDFINGLLEHMRLSADAEITRENEHIRIRISGKDAGAVIGYRGEVLDAVQYLSLWIANKSVKEFIRVSIDAEGYRKRRSDTLKNLAERLARKAVRTGRREILEPMNPFDRRIIHTTLADVDGVETVSEGEGKDRHIVIIPKAERSFVKPKSGITEVTDRRYGTSSSFRHKGAGRGKSYGVPRKKPF